MNFFRDLEKIIESAVNEVMSEDEKALQTKQSKQIDKLNLRAEDDNVSDVDEAEEDETEEQAKLTGDAENVDDEDTPAPADEEQGTASSKKLRDPSKKELKSPSFKSIAQNINLLRGGKSIKDPEVKKNLKAYIEKLEPSERRQVLVYLNSLAQVMAGVTTGSEAANPQQAVKKVKLKKTTKKIKDKKADTGVIVVGE